MDVSRPPAVRRSDLMQVIIDGVHITNERCCLLCVFCGLMTVFAAGELTGEPEIAGGRDDHDEHDEPAHKVIPVDDLSPAADIVLCWSGHTAVFFHRGVECK